VPTSLPLILILKKTYFSPTLHFLTKCILIVQGGFALVLQVCMYHALIKFTSSTLLLLTHFLSPCSPNIQQLTVKCIILYLYVDGSFQYFYSLTFSLPLLSPEVPSDRLTNTILMYVCIYVCVCVCVCICVCVCVYIYIYIYIYTHIYIERVREIIYVPIRTFNL
jgi:hypothetical protein